MIASLLAPVVFAFAAAIPDVEVVLSQALVEQAVEVALTRALDEAKDGLAVGVVPGAPPVRFVPEAALESLTIKKRAGCACLDVVASVMGRLVPDVGMAGLQLQPPRFHVDFAAPLEVAVVGDAVVGRARKGEHFTATAEVLDLPPETAATATRIMQDELTRALAGAGDRSITLLALGAAPATVQGVDVRVLTKGLALDLDLDLPAMAAAAAAAPRGAAVAPLQGFSVVVPKQTLRGVVQRAAAASVAGVVEVRDVLVDATGRLIVDAAWQERRDAPGPAKVVQAAGRVTIDAEGRPVFAADSSTLAMDPGAALVRRDLAKALDATLGFLVPAGDRKLGGRTVRVRATAARGVADALVVDGTFDPR